MFTGIIEETGVVQAVRTGSGSIAVSVGGDLIFGDLKVGDSVAVNGVCLTVARMSGKSFTADVMRETAERSSIGGLKAGVRVNLERAMPAAGRFGGHIVSGHVDGTGRVTDVRSDGNAVRFRIEAPGNVMRHIVEKGSVAVDGASLTVASEEQSGFWVSVIPHTMKSTTLSDRSAGDAVNLESDMIGKYVDKLLEPAGEAARRGGVTMGFLAEHGYGGV